MSNNFTFFPEFIFRSPFKGMGQVDDLKIINDDFFKEAVLLASSDLTASFSRQNINPKEQRQLDRALYNYRVRICTRCTPFGLFAGIGLGSWANHSKITLSDKCRRITRLDMEILCKISDFISNQKYLRPHLKFQINSSAYVVDNQLRYTEYEFKGNRRLYKISSVEFNQYLKRILYESKNGKTITELADLIVDGLVTSQQAEAYIEELINAQVLVADTQPNLTGMDYLERLINTFSGINPLAKNQGFKDCLESLIKIKDTLDRINSSIITASSNYTLLFDLLNKVGVNSTDISGITQTDFSFVPENATLKVSLQEKLIQTLNTLNNISSERPTRIETFKRKFIERYETQFVPILILLDKDLGLGYPIEEDHGINPMVDDLSINQIGNPGIAWSKKDQFLFDKILKAHIQNDKTIEITNEEVSSSFNSEVRISETFSILFSILDSEKDRIFFKSVNGNSATNLISRFGFLNKEIGSLLERVAEFEESQHPDKIIAEIIHLPESRTGNILFRPKFRKFEIPYLAKSSCNSKNQIDLSNVLVSIRGNDLILWDQQLQKEVLPRLGSAHYYASNSLPVYHFLCDLQTQNLIPSISFDWGHIGQMFNFLPRVEIDNVVVSPAMWKISKTIWKYKDDRAIDEAIIKLQQDFKIPKIVLFSEGDNELYFNLSDHEGRKAFYENIKGKEKFLLKEFLYDDRDKALIVNKNGGNHSNECIALVKNNKVNEDIKLPLFINRTKKRKFVPGDNWIYYKIYCGSSSAENILVLNIKEIINRLERQFLIEKWFFIRYADPENHIRIRLLCSKSETISLVMQLFKDSFDYLTEDGIINKITLDTYSRELERYVPENIEDAESVFHHDSNAILQMLSFLKTTNIINYRWKWAIASVDAFLEDFKFRLEDKIQFTSIMKDRFYKEFQLENKQRKIELDKKYRINKSELTEILMRNPDVGLANYEISSFINLRSMKTQKNIANIIKHSNETGIRISYLLDSFIHMSVNRIFIGKQRQHEALIYDFLFRFYSSQKARKKEI